MLALLLAVGVANRASALLRPPDLEPFGSVRVPPEEADALPRADRATSSGWSRPGEPIYVAPRRSDLVTFSNPLLYYLAGRPNVLRRDVLLQAKPEEQAAIVAALRARAAEGDHPLARARVRQARAEPARAAERLARPRRLPRTRPTAEDARFGDYAVLVPR